MNIVLILLIVGLISTMGAANACPIIEVYHVDSNDVTVKQGKTATIQAFLYKQLCLTKCYPPYEVTEYEPPLACYNALLKFTLKDQKGHLLATKTKKTDKYWWTPWPRAICQFNTANMPKGNHILTITRLKPEKGVQEFLRDYRLNVV